MKQPPSKIYSNYILTVLFKIQFAHSGGMTRVKCHFKSYSRLFGTFKTIFKHYFLDLASGQVNLTACFSFLHRLFKPG